jgi:hypothetical protein
MAEFLTDRPELLTSPDDGDFIHIVDVSDVSGNPAGKSKKIETGNYLSGVSISLPDTQIAFGSAVNKVTSDPDFAWDNSNKNLSIAGTFLSSGTFGAGASIGTLGAGSFCYFNHEKSAFRAGQTTVAGEFDQSNVGNNSSAFGLSNIASGNNSSAFGLSNIASGINSFAAGGNLNTVAADDSSISSSFGCSITGGFACSISSAAGCTITNGQACSVLNGLNNTISDSQFSVVGGANSSIVGASHSFAWGIGATSAHNCTVVFSDGQVGTFSSTIENSLSIRMENGVGINTNAVDSSSTFDIASTTKGSRPFPLMSQAQRDNIPFPANGLIIDNTDTNALNRYNGTSWEQIAVSSTSNIQASISIQNTCTLNLSGTIYNNLINIPYSSKAEGTWTKITGLQKNTSKNIIFADDSAVVQFDGSYKVDYSITLSKAGTGSRAINIAIPINADDTDKLGVNDLQVVSGGWEASGSDFQLFSGSCNMQLEKDDNVKFFISLIHQSGTATQDIDIAPCDITIHRIGDLVLTPAFISTWNTSNPGTSLSDQISLPLEASGTYSFTVDWGDGATDNITTWNQPETTHTYPSSGIYSVRITGIIDGFSFNNSGDKDKIISVDECGILKIGNSGGYFLGCSNLDWKAVDPLDLSGTTNFTSAFSGISAVSGSMNLFNTSTITNMQGCFFNSSANPDVSKWNVSNVTNFTSTFSAMPNFNNSLDSWVTSSAISMLNMFKSSTIFNQDISNFDFSSVTSLGDGVGGILSNAFAFSTANYDLLLISLDSQTLQPSEQLDCEAQYSAGAAATARNNIITNDLWTINDGGQVP